MQESFESGMRLALMANFESAVDACLELIDNGVDDWEGENQTVPIEIRMEISDDRVSILNVGETGMGESELKDFIKWGFSRKKGRIGQWGQGGKAAMGYIAHGMRIKCTKKGEDVGWELEDSKWGDRDYFVNLDPKPFPALGKEAYVQIELFNLKHNLRFETLVKRLSEVYRPLLESKKVSIYVAKTKQKGEWVKPRYIPLKEGPESFEIDLSDGKKLHGWIGIMVPRIGKGTEGLKGGARCYHYGRLVSSGEFFGHPRPEYKATLNTLIAEVNVDFPVSPNLNKNNFDRDSVEWNEIERVMYRQLRSWVNKLIQEKEEEVPKKEKERAKVALNLIQKALRELDKRLTGKFGEQQGQKETGAQELAEENLKTKTRKERSDKGGSHEPATPPPTDAAGTRRRLGGVDVDVQVGDGTERSRIMETNGSIKVIIYSEYPAYRATKGDIVYLMETISLELAKPGPDDPKDLDGYLQRVNGALYLASKELLRSKR